MRYVASRYHDVEDVRAIHADHIVARTMLEDLQDSWIALFPVYKSSNSGFGSIERNLKKPQMGLKELLSLL